MTTARLKSLVRAFIDKNYDVLATANDEELLQVADCLALLEHIAARAAAEPEIQVVNGKTIIRYSLATRKRITADACRAYDRALERSQSNWSNPGDWRFFPSPAPEP